MSHSTDTHVFILAAGKGTRMHSAIPKIMHPLAGLPLIGHVLQTVKSLNPTTCTLVIAPDMTDAQHFSKHFYPAIQLATQDQQLGTAHALMSGVAIHPHLKGKVIIVFGDTPLIRPETLKGISKQLDEGEIVLVGMTPGDPKQYARIVLGKDQLVDKVIEYKDASPEERAIPLCNSGIIGLQAICLQELLPQIQASPLTGEYYLFETIALAKKANYKIGFMEIEETEAEGVNTRADLAYCESLFQQRYRQEMMRNGVTLVDPSNTYFSYDTKIEPDVVIDPYVFFGPKVIVESGTHIRAFSHIEETTIHQKAVIGPFARLRSQTEVGAQSWVGNFVEVTQSTLGSGVKAKHLSYLGNATVGDNVNIGAGTITCNYDGTTKWPTTIGPRAFIGSNTALVAPVHINADVIIGAGSIITKDVEAEALALTPRSPQKHIQKGAPLFRAKCLERKITKEKT